MRKTTTMERKLAHVRDAARALHVRGQADADGVCRLLVQMLDVIIDPEMTYDKPELAPFDEGNTKLSDELRRLHKTLRGGFHAETIQCLLTAADRIEVID